MSRSPLYEALVAAAIRVGEFGGIETALAFSDRRTELTHLRVGCGVYDLGWRAKIVVTGSDRVRWMNGMVTNNIRDLPTGRGNYNFLLNPQGRILADLYVYNRGEYQLVDTDAWQAPKVLEIFDKYIIMDDVEVADVSAKLTALGLMGPKAGEVLKSIGLNAARLEPLQVLDTTWDDVGLSLVRMDRAESFEIWLAPANASRLWEALLGAGAAPVGVEAVEMEGMLEGIPRYGRDIRDRDLPQETEQNRALNFSKGCYLGQEIVERIHSRGQVHRKFRGMVVEGPPPAAGTKIKAADKEVGEVTSATAIPSNTGEKALALGYLRVEAGLPGTEVQVNGVRAVVIPLPFKTD